MNIPKWLKAYLRPDECGKIVAAIQDAESTTSGELVPMIVRRSSTTGHVPVILLGLIVVLFFVFSGPSWQSDILGDHWLWYLADIALLLILTAVGARFPWMQRLLTTRADQAVQVNSRSMVEFYESNINRTKDATGVLIFVSLMERRAVVLADQAINEKVPTDTWQEVCSQLINSIKKKNLGPALCEAILACGKIMTPQFPIQADDQNELKNQLIIKE